MNSENQGLQICVDDFIKQNINPKFHPVVSLIRDIMVRNAPEAKEVMAYGIPAFRRKKIITVISPTKSDITLSFTNGASCEDKYQKLAGVGKKSKYIKFKKTEDIDEAVLVYYIKQAIKFDDF